PPGTHPSGDPNPPRCGSRVRPASVRQERRPPNAASTRRSGCTGVTPVQRTPGACAPPARPRPTGPLSPALPAVLDLDVFSALPEPSHFRRHSHQSCLTISYFLHYSLPLTSSRWLPPDARRGQRKTAGSPPAGDEAAPSPPLRSERAGHPGPPGTGAPPGRRGLRPDLHPPFILPSHRLAARRRALDRARG